MPEGDTIFLSATNLRRALAGKRIVRNDFRVPKAALVDLSGQTITEIVPRGKHLLFRTDQGWTLHTHYRLDGQWKLFKRGARWRGPAHEIRAIVETEDWTAVGYTLATVEVIPTRDEHTVVGHLGPDPLGPDWDIEEALRRMSKDPDRTIGDVLLDQTIVAGWGNAYKNEICYLRGLDPWTRVGDVKDLRALIELGRRLLLANRTTGRWITTGDLHSREGQWVFERANKPCRRCGTKIELSKQECAGYWRLTYTCARCQPRG